MIVTYQYGCPDHKISPKLPENVYRQFFLENLYWNRLVELHLEFEKKYKEDVLTDENTLYLQKQIDNLSQQVQKIRDFIKNERKRKRRGIDFKEERQKIKELKGKINFFKQNLKTKKREAREKNREIKIKLDREFKEIFKKTRQEFAAKGLFWPNYNEIGNRFLTARKLILKKRAQGKPSQLRFQKFIGTGCLVVQIPRGMPVEQFYKGGNNFLSIEPAFDTSVWQIPFRGERRRACRTTLKVRTGSNGRAPIWFRLPFIFHRPLPKNGLIKEVKVIRRRKPNNKWKWSINFFVECPEESIKKPVFLKKKEAVAIDLGWRRKKEGLRVGFWTDSEGNKGEIILDNSYLNTLQRLQDLQSIIDQEFNAFKDEMVKELEKYDRNEITALFDNISKWKSPNKYTNILFYWIDNRFSGDEKLWNIYTSWRKRHIHLWTWFGNLFRKLAGRRNQFYRDISNRFAYEYKVVLVKDSDLSTLLIKGNPEEETQKQNSVRRRQSKLASCGVLRDYIKWACFKYSADYRELSSINTTKICHKCGEIMEGINFEKNIVVRCPKCFSDFDQDENSTRNMLAILKDINFKQEIKKVANY